MNRLAGPVTIRRIAIASLFFVHGGVLGSWVVHIPTVQQRLAIGEGTLGLALLGTSLGAILAMPFAGGATGKLGSKPVAGIASLAYCLVLPALLLLPSTWALAGGLLVLGASGGCQNVAMNAQAVALGRRYESPIMSSFHALFSIGGLVGSGGGGLMLRAGLGPEAHLLGAAALLVGVTGLAYPALLPPRVDAEPDERPMFRWPDRALWGLGLLAFLTLLAEGAMSDWSAVYLRRALETSPAMASTGYAAFSTAMAAGRLGGDRVADRIGRTRLVRWGSTVAAAGLGGAVLLHRPWAAVAGFATMGIGLANVIPILFGAAGRQGAGSSGSGIAAVTTTGYIGLLSGPPLIGWASEWAGLPLGMGLVAASVGLVAGLTVLVSPDGR